MFQRALSVIFQVNEVDLGPTLTPLANGEVITSGTLDEGSHLVTVLATDSAGKVGTDTTTITVGPPNSPPVCAITSPVSGSASQQGATVAFAGTATDPDIDSNFLSVEWRSDKVVTPIGSSIPNNNGDIAFLVNSLPAEPQTITMMVTDEIGATCSDSIEFVVGTPPTIFLTSPVNGGEYIAGTGPCLRRDR